MRKMRRYMLIKYHICTLISELNLNVFKRKLYSYHGRTKTICVQKYCICEMNDMSVRRVVPNY